jgi:GNAT superfamily N-acetyltransferase
MELEAVLELFDREQRQHITYPGMRREETPHVIRMIPEHAPEGTIIYSRLPDQGIDEVIKKEIQYFSELGLDFEWKAYRHDKPDGLNTILADLGFEVETPDSVMVFDLQEANTNLNSSIVDGIRRLTSIDEIEQVMAVQKQVWEDDMTQIATYLKLQMEENPDLISIYAAYENDKPVSDGWITYHPGSQFAGLWGGTTLPDFRNRGYYSSLLKVRMQEAIKRGIRYVTVDASPMSRPILENFGFQCITHAWRCVWHVNKK